MNLSTEDALLDALINLTKDQYLYSDDVVRDIVYKEMENGVICESNKNERLTKLVKKSKVK